MRWFVGLGSLVHLVSSAACDLDALLSGDECTQNSDCSGDDKCDDGACVECENDGDCDDDEECDDGECDPLPSEGEGELVGEGEGEGVGEGEGEGGIAGPLRLVAGATPNEGRLEIQIDGVFGTICDDGFDIEEATVACRQLGFSAGTGVQGGGFAPGSEAQTIFLDDVVCTGSEARLIDCAHAGIGVHNCSHSEDVGVTCE